MVMMERARTVIPEYGRNVDNNEIHMTYEEQLIARAKHRQYVASITGISQKRQQQHSQEMER